MKLPEVHPYQIGSSYDLDTFAVTDNYAYLIKGHSAREDDLPGYSSQTLNIINLKDKSTSQTQLDQNSYRSLVVNSKGELFGLVGFESNGSSDNTENDLYKIDLSELKIGKKLYIKKDFDDPDGGGTLSYSGKHLVIVATGTKKL